MWKPNRQEIQNYTPPSLGDAYKQVSNSVDRIMDWGYDNNKGIRTFAGTGMVLGGLLGMISAGMIVEPQRARDLGIVLSAMVEVGGLAFLLSAIGDYKFAGERGKEGRSC